MGQVPKGDFHEIPLVTLVLEIGFTDTYSIAKSYSLMMPLNKCNYYPM